MINESELLSPPVNIIGAYEMAPSPIVPLTNLSKVFLNRTIHDAGHDLRSPLFVIRGYSQLLQRTDDKDCLKRGIKMMEEASYKLENTVNGFVELMDIYTLPNPERKILSIDSEIDSVSKNLSSLKKNIGSIINKRIELKEKLFFNEEHFNTILTNLIDNAVRHNSGQEDLEITISYKRMDNDKTLLVIEDNGRGVDLSIEKEIKLKKPFYKNGQDDECIGVGLAKIEAIAQITKSTFTIESTPGAGMKCMFVFR